MKALDRFKGLFAPNSAAVAKPVVTDDAVKALKFNPLELTPGQAVQIDTVDYSKNNFVVEEITQAVSEDKTWASYKLVDKAKNGDQEQDVTVWLRAFRDRNALRLIALKLHERAPAESGIQGALDDRGGHMVIDVHGDGKLIENYHRLEGRRTALLATFRVLADRDGDGTVQEAEAKTCKMRVYDYSRQAPVDGVQMTQYLFVETDDSGFYDVLRGFEVSPSDVEY